MIATPQTASGQGWVRNQAVRCQTNTHRLCDTLRAPSHTGVPKGTSSDSAKALQKAIAAEGRK